MKNGKSFQPSPKRPRKNKSRKKTKSAKEQSGQGESDFFSQAEFLDGIKGKGKETFGVELTNSETLLEVGSPPKRVAAEMLEGESVETPQKHKKGKVSVDEGSDDDWEQWEPPAPLKAKSREPGEVV